MGIFFTLWQLGSVADMFKEALHCMQRRQATKGYTSSRGVDPAHFFMYCSCPDITSMHPQGYAISGITVTKQLVGRLMYLTLYVLAFCVGKFFLVTRP